MLDIERKLTPELKEILDSGAFTKTTASKILVKLSAEEQTELLSTFGDEILQGATQKQMEQYALLVQQRDQRISDLEAEMSRLEYDVEKAKDELEKLTEEMPEDMEEVLEIRNDLENEISKQKEKVRKEFERAESLKKNLEAKEREVENKEKEIAALRIRPTDKQKIFHAACYSFISHIDTAQNIQGMCKEEMQLLKEAISEVETKLQSLKADMAS